MSACNVYVIHQSQACVKIKHNPNPNPNPDLIHLVSPIKGPIELEDVANGHISPFAVSRMRKILDEKESVILKAHTPRHALTYTTLLQY